MAKLVWGVAGERYFETGVDRGVLYVDGVGVPWNGLTSVSEAVTGSEPKPYYLDGIKYANISGAEEFGATINAFSSPPEFARCDGTAAVNNGLFITEQPRRPFSFSYRTRIGNDLVGTDYGYKLHIVYNALAAASNRDYATMGDSPSANALSWSVTTTPPRISGYRPTAHMVIDSSKTPAFIMGLVELILYGSSTSSPRLPSPDELISMFSDFEQLETYEQQANGTFAVRLYAYLESPTQPLVGAGQEAIWLNTSVAPATLNYITGD